MADVFISYARKGRVKGVVCVNVEQEQDFYL